MNEMIQSIVNRAGFHVFAQGHSRSGRPTVTHRSESPLTRTAVIIVMVGMLCILAGCGKDEKVAVPTPADIKPVNPNDSEKAQEQTRVQQLVAHNKGIQAPPAALKLRGGEPATPEVLEAYNQELTRVRFKMGESPESLQELKTKWIQARRLLPPLPTPPPGKKIVYDPLRIIIRLDPP